MGKQNKNKYKLPPLPEGLGAPSASADATAVKPIIPLKKQIGNYKKVDSTKADIFRNVVFPIVGGPIARAMPSNIRQLAAKLTGDARMSNSSLSDQQKVMLWDVIQQAMKRNGTPNGGTVYQDYETLGMGSGKQYDDWFNHGSFGVAEGAISTATNPGFVLGSTVGRGNYFTDPENPKKIYYTDVYDWNPGEKMFNANSTYKIIRNALRKNEDQHLNVEKNNNYRMNFEFDADEIEKLRKSLGPNYGATLPVILPEDLNKTGDYIDKGLKEFSGFSNQVSNWLDKFDDGGELDPFGSTVARKDVTSLAPKVILKTKKQAEQDKIANEAMRKRNELAQKDREARANAKEIQDRRDRIAAADAMKDKQYDSAENYAIANSAIADRVRFSEKPNVFDDYFNPAAYFGGFGSGLAQIPLNIKQGDYTQAAENVLTPVAAGLIEEAILTPVTKKVLSAGKKALGNVANKVSKAAKSAASESNQLPPPPDTITIPNSERVVDRMDRLRDAFWRTGNLTSDEVNWLQQNGGYGSADVYAPFGDITPERYNSAINAIQRNPAAEVALTPREQSFITSRHTDLNGLTGVGNNIRADINALIAPPIPPIIRNYTYADFTQTALDNSLSGRMHRGIQNALGMITDPATLYRSQSPLQRFGETLYTGITGRTGFPPTILRNTSSASNAVSPVTSLVNKSGFTKEEVLAKASDEAKEVISNMSDKEFAETVFKPSGQVAKYTYDNPPSSGEIQPLTADEYAQRFNSRLDLLNDIIAKNNKSGVEYQVTGISPFGELKFYTPKQVQRWQDSPPIVSLIESLEKLKSDPVELQKRLQANAQTLEDFERILDSYKQDKIIMPEGTSSWSTRIVPGEWRGEVQDVANAMYYQDLPGLNMSSTTSSVFPDFKPRRGTGTYESINEYLKALDLGRVKPGFNSQTDKSFGLWNSAIQKGKAAGYHHRPNIIYGSMKKNGGWLEKYNDGGPVQENYNDYSVTVPPNYKGEGYFNEGRDYSPAWGGQFQMGGSIGGATQGIPGATGFMYARDSGSNPSEDKYAKKNIKTVASAQNGKKVVKEIPKVTSTKFLTPERKDDEEITKPEPPLEDIETTLPNPSTAKQDKEDEESWKKVEAEMEDNKKQREEAEKRQAVADWLSQQAAAQRKQEEEDRGYRSLQGVSGSIVKDLEKQLNASTNKYNSIYDYSLNKYHNAYDEARFASINESDILASKKKIADYINSPLYAKRQDYNPEQYYGEVADIQGIDERDFQNDIARQKREARLTNLANSAFEITKERSDYYKPASNSLSFSRTNDSAVIGHELGHNVTSDPYAKTPDGFVIHDDKGPMLKEGYDKYSDIYNSKSWDVTKTTPKEDIKWGYGYTGYGLNKAEVDKFVDFANPTYGQEDDPHYDKSIANKQKFAGEQYGDLMALRELMHKYGITNTFGEDIDKGKVDKALKNKNITTHPSFKRFYQRYGPNGIIQLNNTIAANNMQQGAPMAQNGMEMKFYQDGLDFKPKSISKNGKKVIKDDRGQWAHPGKITKIGSNQITMQGVPYPVLGISDTGDTQMMYPNQEYQYDGSSVTEYPVAQDGRNVAYVDSVLNANKNLNWVKRLYDVNRKSIMLPGQKDPATHYMESGDGRVYPTVVEMPNGKLKHLGDKAFDYADSTNTFIQFPNDSTAQWFGKNYKQGTGVLKKKKQGGQLTKLDQLTNFTNYNTKQPGGWLDKYQ